MTVSKTWNTPSVKLSHAAIAEILGDRAKGCAPDFFNFVALRTSPRGKDNVLCNNVMALLISGALDKLPPSLLKQAASEMESGYSTFNALMVALILMGRMPAQTSKGLAEKKKGLTPSQVIWQQKLAAAVKQHDGAVYVNRAPRKIAPLPETAPATKDTSQQDAS